MRKWSHLELSEQVTLQSGKQVPLWFFNTQVRFSPHLLPQVALIHSWSLQALVWAQSASVEQDLEAETNNIFLVGWFQILHFQVRILKICEIALFTRAMPGSSLVYHMTKWTGIIFGYEQIGIPSTEAINIDEEPMRRAKRTLLIGYPVMVFLNFLSHTANYWADAENCNKSFLHHTNDDMPPNA